MEVSMTQIILETKNKIERNKKLFPNNLSKLKQNFLNVSGMSEQKWDTILNFPPIKDQNDFNRLLGELRGRNNKNEIF